MTFLLTWRFLALKFCSKVHKFVSTLERIIYTIVVTFKDASFFFLFQTEHTPESRFTASFKLQPLQNSCNIASFFKQEWTVILSMNHLIFLFASSNVLFAISKNFFLKIYRDWQEGNFWSLCVLNLRLTKSFFIWFAFQKLP